MLVKLHQSKGRSHRRYRKFAKSVTAAESNVMAVENERLAAPPMLPTVSNGLPPPLWSFVFSWPGIAFEVEVCSGSEPVVGVFDVSTNNVLESIVLMLDAVKTPEVTVLFTVLVVAEELPDVYGVHEPDGGPPVYVAGAF